MPKDFPQGFSHPPGAGLAGPQLDSHNTQDLALSLTWSFCVCLFWLGNYTQYCSELNSWFCRTIGLPWIKLRSVACKANANITCCNIALAPICLDFLAWIFRVEQTWEVTLSSQSQQRVLSFFFCFGSHPALCSGITPVTAQGTICCVRD